MQEENTDVVSLLFSEAIHQKSKRIVSILILVTISHMVDQIKKYF